MCHQFNVNSCEAAIPLPTTDLSCGRSIKDSTCRRYAADEMIAMAGHRFDPNIATIDGWHLHAKATDPVLGWRPWCSALNFRHHGTRVHLPSPTRIPPFEGSLAYQGTGRCALLPNLHLPATVLQAPLRCS